VTGRYGSPPVEVAVLHLDWDELMHWLYLPVKMPGTGLRLPPNLMFAVDAVHAAMFDAADQGREVQDDYVYLTARRGFASAGSPLNRPGWHCDGFGTDDLNHVWSDRWPTRYWESPSEPKISPDHHDSLREFEELARILPWNIREMSPERLYRLDPYVIHDVPQIPAGEGGMRSFLKVSFSRHRYNLVGNSHNHEFDYAWKMWPRDIARNDPAAAQADYYEEA